MCIWLFWRTHSNDLKYWPLPVIFPLISSEKSWAPAPPYDPIRQLYSEIKILFLFSKLKDPSSQPLPIHLVLQSPTISVALHKPHSGISLFISYWWAHTGSSVEQRGRILSLSPPNTAQDASDLLCCKGTLTIPLQLAFHKDSPGFFFCQAALQLFVPPPGMKMGFLIPSIGLGTWICCTPLSPLSHCCLTALSSSPAFHCAAIPRSGVTWKPPGILHSVF